MKTILLCWLCALNAFGVIIEWSSNTESNVAYRVHAGRTSRSYETNFTTTNTFYEIAKTNLFPSTNFFAVTAFYLDDPENEGDFSEEVFWVNGTNKPAPVKGLRVRKLFVQSAPAVIGPWGQDVEITQVETAIGTDFYRLRIGPDVVSGSLKRFISTAPTKGARVMPGRVLGPPPMPPK